MAQPADRAWLAGLFEGEGCISFSGRNSVTLTVGGTDRDVIARCHAVAGVGAVRLDSRRAEDGRRKPLWSWSVTRKGAVLAVFDMIESQMGSRRRSRIEEARARLTNCHARGRCRKGHPMEGANLYVSPAGQRQCIACRDEREAARPARSR